LTVSVVLSALRCGSRCPLDNQPLFPEFCAGNEKWLRQPWNCFVARPPDDTIPAKPSDFSRVPRAPCTLVESPVRTPAKAMTWLGARIRNLHRSSENETSAKTCRFDAGCDFLTFLVEKALDAWRP
jgi:hypothetical protein